MLKKVFRISFVLCLVCIAGWGNAQSSPQGRALPGSVAAPVLTFIVDNTNRIRPLNGIAGSAWIGNPLDVGFQVARSEVPPAHDYMIATTAANWPLFLQFSGNTVTARGMDSMLQRIGRADRRYPVSRDLPAINRVTLSPSGFSAALVSESASKIYAFSNLSQSPRPAGTFDTTGLGQLSAVAINDDGKSIIVGTSDGNVGGLYLIRLGEPARLIASSSHPSAATFLHKSDWAVVADDVENKIHIVSNGQIVSSVGQENGIAGPIGVASSNDNRQVLVGNAQTGSVVMISYDGQITEPLYCDCAITGLYPTNADSVFRLTDFSDSGPVLLFDASAKTPRIIFAPVRTSPF